MSASQTHCYSHDESRATERSKAASKAAKAKAGELAEVKDQIRKLIAGVLLGKVPAREAAVALTGYGVLRQYVSEERQREVLKLEERLSALEKELGIRERAG